MFSNAAECRDRQVRAVAHDRSEQGLRIGPRRWNLGIGRQHHVANVGQPLAPRDGQKLGVHVREEHHVAAARDSQGVSIDLGVLEAPALDATPGDQLCELRAAELPDAEEFVPHRGRS
jgi:hypothetical protein